MLQFNNEELNGDLRRQIEGTLISNIAQVNMVKS